MFGRFMPREGRFFELFDAHAAQLVEGARALKAFMEALGNEPEQAKAMAEAVFVAESRADRITHDTVTLLHTTFITPLDRDDIHDLINGMDDILDLMQDAVHTVRLYDVQRSTPEARQLCDLTVACVERVKTAVALIDDADAVLAMRKTCEEIDALESEADRVMRNAIGRLFRDEQDMRELFRLKSVYELLETVTDRCEEVAQRLEAIALENS
jgi:predicted phosphate transport protein (TIGR00153 family)